MYTTYSALACQQSMAPFIVDMPVGHQSRMESEVYLRSIFSNGRYFNGFTEMT